MSRGTMKLGRDDYKKKKELDELRKLGAAPAEVDEDGYIINPHIPQYMSDAPWYLSTGQPSLKHQRIYKNNNNIASIYDEIQKGEIKGINKRSKYVDGGCENCGAMTHKRRDCTERPRKRMAKYSNINIANDEYVPNNDGKIYTYDGKRDRWNNYNIANHQYIMERHNKIESERRKKKAIELDKALLNDNGNSNDNDNNKKIKKYRKRKAKLKDKNSKDNNDSNNNNDSDSDSDSDDDSDIDSNDDMKDTGQIIQRLDSKKRQTVRNLRIREDVAKYLRNLGMCFYIIFHECGRIY